MNQIIEKKNESRYETISEITGKIQRDIAYLSKNLELIDEEIESKLVEDLDRFLIDDIARELRLSVYDPLQNNRVFIEYCYKVEPSSYSSAEKWDSQVTILDIPDTCLFDIFIYFSRNFSGLKSEFQREFIKDFNLDWYDLDFNLKYSKKDKRKKAGTIHSEKLSLNRYLYESPLEEAPEATSDKPVDKKLTLSANKEGNEAEKFNKFEKELIYAIQGGKKLNYVIYKDIESAAASIREVLYKFNKIPIRWSLSRGFTMDKLSKRQGSGDFNSIRNVKNPASALNFIMENIEERVSYIFEDFHHHIGGASTINSAVAEIRSIVRELSRDLRERNEFVFFLSPSDSLPIELASAFNVIKQETEGQGVSFLDKYGYIMTTPAACEEIKPLIGREDKVKRMIQVLCQMETNNPVLVGGAGVGKTALVEGLAAEIIRGNVPSVLEGKTIFSLNLTTLVAGSRYRGDFEERINAVLDEVKSHYGKIIVFIDEIHTLLGAGSAEGSSGAEDVLKPALARGDFPCIGATTYEGYESILSDPALARRFQKLDIPPATVEEAENILRGVRQIFEKHHDVRIDDEAIKAAVRLSEEWIHDQFLPGKAVRLLDSTSSFVKLDGRQTVCVKDIEDEMQRSRS